MNYAVAQNGKQITRPVATREDLYAADWQATHVVTPTGYEVIELPMNCPKCAEIRAKTERVIAECHKAGLRGHRAETQRSSHANGSDEKDDPA
jgi:hypothetical protein